MYSSGEYLVFLKPNVIPLKGWLYELLHAHHKTKQSFTMNTLTSPSSGSPSSGSTLKQNEIKNQTRFDGGIVGSVIMYPSGKVFSSGYEYFDTPIMNPSETIALNQAAKQGINHHYKTERSSSSSASSSSSSSSWIDDDDELSESGVVLPHHKFRGYHSRDLRISPSGQLSHGKDDDENEMISTKGVSRHCMLLSRKTFFDLHGFDIGYTSGYEDADLSLRLLLKYNQLTSSSDVKENDRKVKSLGLVVTASRSRVISMNPEGYPELDNS